LELLTEAELTGFFARFVRSARRFELRERYNSDVGRESFRRFLANEPDDYGWHRSWMAKIGQDVAAGKVWQRVRIVSVPLSDYTRYGIRVGRLSVEAGEDIRYLARATATALDLAPYDAWLLDDEVLIRLHFNDADDTFIGAEVVDEISAVERHLSWWPVAWEHAQPLAEFADAHR
jgi:hypothetical protein